MKAHIYDFHLNNTMSVSRFRFNFEKYSDNAKLENALIALAIASIYGNEIN